MNDREESSNERPDVRKWSRASTFDEFWSIFKQTSRPFCDKLFFTSEPLRCVVQFYAILQVKK